MKHTKMTARDVRSTGVITVAPDSSVEDIARTLLTGRISAVPVVADDGALVGIVSEGDLIHRHETMTEHHGSWLSEMFQTNEELAGAYSKAHGRLAADVMTRSVVTVKEATPLGEIADLMVTRRIKRVPVVDGAGNLLGIVSRADLLRALLMAADEPGEDEDPGPGIRERVLKELRDNKLTDSHEVNVIVADGVVELWGVVESRQQRRAILIAAENTRGVAAVRDHIALFSPPTSSGL